MTLRAGLIGAHISRTRLPAALEMMCQAHGLAFEFDLIDTAETPGFDFVETVDQLRMDGWSGVTVTHPFKTQAADYAGVGMAADVAHLGASNTLVFGDELRGFNTDFTGFLAAFEAVSDRGPVVMCGAGGVARSLGAALIGEGVSELVIYDVALSRAEDLARRIGPPARAIPVSDLAAAARWASGLVNATPLGMVAYPGTAFEAAWLGKQVWAFDAVYTPTDTQFLQDAAAAGIACLSGFDLFRHMAIRSFAAYTGIMPDVVKTLKELEELRP